jgi:glucose-6-phosphate 1-dehydrogenase
MEETAINPFREGMQGERPAEPCIVVIFGARGDLANRKLFPALMNLARDKSLADNTVFVGVSRKEANTEDFRQLIFESAEKFAPDIPLDLVFRQSFGERLFSVMEDPEGQPFSELPVLLSALQARFHTRGNLLFYLAVPPPSFAAIVREIAASGLNQSKDAGWTRIVIEKPFGSDLESARELDKTIAEVFREDQIYRIDHYMGKEAVQNIMVLRLANAFLEPLWNRRYIDHVQITAAESVGVEDRADYYESAGSLRDMVQNHLLQILAMIGMEPPAKLTPEAIRNEKTKVLESIRPISDQALRTDVIRAQYAAGALNGKKVVGYREERRVKPDSTTDTYCALKLWIDNWRWQGVPFYLRTGKRLPKRITEVAIQFKPVPHQIFSPSPAELTEPNVLAIRIQPGEGITLKFIAKLPGHSLRLRSADMEFRYGTSFGGRVADAYERLLLDAILGDPTLFARWDAVEQGWKLTTPILRAWEQGGGSPLAGYPAGSWGPTEADRMIEADGRLWRTL